MSPSSTTAAVLRALPLLAWCVLVFALSHQSDPEEAVGFSLEVPDWAVHGIEYLVGGVLAGVALPPHLPVRRAVLVAFGFLALFAASDEWHQSFVPGRDASAVDLFADCVGAALGIALHALARRRRG